GLERMLEWLRSGDADERRGARRTLWMAAGVLGVCALLTSAGALLSIWQAVFGIAPGREQALAANAQNTKVGFWIAFGIAAIVAAVWEAGTRALLSPRIALVVLGFVAVQDLYRVGRPFVEGTLLLQEYYADPALFQPDETIAFLQAQQETDGFRVFDLGLILEPESPAYRQNVLATNGVEQVAGHHGNEMGRYRTLIGGERGFNIYMSRLKLLDLLNARFLVSNQLFDMGAGYTEVFRGSRSV